MLLLVTFCTGLSRQPRMGCRSVLICAVTFLPGTRRTCLPRSSILSTFIQDSERLLQPGALGAQIALKFDALTSPMLAGICVALAAGAKARVCKMSPIYPIEMLVCR